MKERLINTRFWNDGWVRSINPLDRYLFLYLLTNEYTNISGIYELPLQTIAYGSGIDERDLKVMLKKLEPKVFYKEGWVILTNFLKYQRTASRTVFEGVIGNLKGVPRSVLELAVKKGYGEEIQGISIIEEMKNSREQFTKRHAILIRDNFICSYCSREVVDKNFEIDHINPKADGGKNLYSNLTLSCMDCNQKKSNLSALEFCGREIKANEYHIESAITLIKNNEVVRKKFFSIYPHMSYIYDVRSYHISESESNLNLKKSSSSKKMYYKGLEMRKYQGKLWVIPKDGGAWLEFAGKEEEIEWK